ncbi:thioredoxin domain-containing protein [Robertmurraya massiliosenegalensis]|uniref:thioredoxin domain-containing protein n=1 Tax=Robertmurraya massiliosenegalensis TaxID=1287657 RepID=UPI0002DFFB71|nr:thioredoxin domain-containing protein [Robertmurraya massiliosenegalensis]
MVDGKRKSKFALILFLLIFLLLALLKWYSTQDQVVMEPIEEPRWLLFHAGACEACQKMMELSSKIEDEYREKVEFVHVPFDNIAYNDMIKDYRVNFIPTSVFEVEGQERITRIGYIPEQELREILDNMEKENE